LADRLARAGWLAFVVAAGAMVATPLVRRGSRAGLANAVIGGMAGVTLASSARAWKGRRAVVACATIAAGTFAAERVGSRTGIPFGRYHYTNALRPQVAGVPMAVPVAWFAVAVPARETARAVLGPRSSAISRVAVGAACLTAWDAFLDPQMTAEGYWRWERSGRYRGIPASNFAGWFAVGVGVMAALELLQPPVAPPDPVAVGLYAFLAVMQTLGAAAFFDDPVAAVVGGLAMLPPAAVAVRRVRAGG
jgi:putative membrane protein